MEDVEVAVGEGLQLHGNSRWVLRRCTEPYNSAIRSLRLFTRGRYGPGPVVLRATGIAKCGGQQFMKVRMMTFCISI